MSHGCTKVFLWSSPYACRSKHTNCTLATGDRFYDFTPLQANPGERVHERYIVHCVYVQFMYLQCTCTCIYTCTMLNACTDCFDGYVGRALARMQSVRCKSHLSQLCLGIWVVLYVLLFLECLCSNMNALCTLSTCIMRLLACLPPTMPVLCCAVFFFPVETNTILISVGQFQTTQVHHTCTFTCIRVHLCIIQIYMCI